MKVGYARVSTHDQNIDLQVDALKKEGCEKIFTDIVSGAKANRPGLNDLMKFVREGDTIVVWKLDRLGRSIKHLLDTMEELEKCVIGFKSLQESIDTSTPTGILFFQLIAVFAEFERNLIRERTKAGLSAARVRGRKGGRPRVLNDTKINRAEELLKTFKVDEVAKMLNASRATLLRELKKKKEREMEKAV